MKEAFEVMGDHGCITLFLGIIFLILASEFLDIFKK